MGGEGGVVSFDFMDFHVTVNRTGLPQVLVGLCPDVTLCG